MAKRRMSQLKKLVRQAPEKSWRVKEAEVRASLLRETCAEIFKALLKIARNFAKKGERNCRGQYGLTDIPNWWELRGVLDEVRQGVEKLLEEEGFVEISSSDIERDMAGDTRVDGITFHFSIPS